MDHINIHTLNRKWINIWHQGPLKKLQVPTNQIRPKNKKRNGTGSARNKGHKQIEYNRKQEQQLWAKSKNKKQARKIWAKPIYKKEDSDDSRRIQARQTWWNHI